MSELKLNLRASLLPINLQVQMRSAGNRRSNSFFISNPSPKSIDSNSQFGQKTLRSVSSVSKFKQHKSERKESNTNSNSLYREVEDTKERKKKSFRFIIKKNIRLKLVIFSLIFEITFQFMITNLLNISPIYRSPAQCRLIRDYLCTLDYFKNLQNTKNYPEILKRFSETAKIQVINKGDILFYYGDISDRFHNIINGSVRAFLPKKNDQIQKDIQNKKDLKNAQNVRNRLKIKVKEVKLLHFKSKNGY